MYFPCVYFVTKHYMTDDDNDDEYDDDDKITLLLVPVPCLVTWKLMQPSHWSPSDWIWLCEPY